MRISKNLEYHILGISLILLQFAGYSVMTLPLLALSAILMFSFDRLQTQLTCSSPFSLFLILSVLVGLINLIFKNTTNMSIMMWGQFYFLALILACAEDKARLISIIKYFVYAIFIGDILSNILLALGFSLPWTGFSPIRPGEILPRFPGIKNSSLYSGSISFLAICCLMQEHLKHTWVKNILIFIMSINLLLAGSFRYYIILAAVLGLYYFQLYLKPKKLLAFYGLFILFVVTLTYFTKEFSKSNELRWKLWNHTIDLISQSPILGRGFFFQDLGNHLNFSYHNLAVAGVTESTILLFALCFGIPIMLIFIFVIYKTIKQYDNYIKYEQELGFFLGLTLDLFWGGSLDNCMSLSILLLSLYQINDVAFRKHIGNQHDGK